MILSCPKCKRDKFYILKDTIGWNDAVTVRCCKCKSDMVIIKDTEEIKDEKIIINNSSNINK